MKIHKIKKNGRIVEYTMNELVALTGLHRVTLAGRLRNSTDWKKVNAPKGKHVGHGYDTKKKTGKTINQNWMKESKAEISKKAKLIKSTHPFYSKGEEGDLHRLLFGSWEARS